MAKTPELPKCWGPGSVLGQGTRSHHATIKISHVTTRKILCVSQLRPDWPNKKKLFLKTKKYSNKIKVWEF